MYDGHLCRPLLFFFFIEALESEIGEESDAEGSLSSEDIAESFDVKSENDSLMKWKPMLLEIKQVFKYFKMFITLKIKFINNMLNYIQDVLSVTER